MFTSSEKKEEWIKDKYLLQKYCDRAIIKSGNTDSISANTEYSITMEGYLNKMGPKEGILSSAI